MPTFLTTRFLLALPSCLALQLSGVAAPAMRPTASTALVARATPPAMLDIDGNTLIGAATLVVSLGGGIALVSFTENAGKKNDEVANAQPCVVCKVKKVTTCTICQGSGVDPLAQYVAGVREMAGEEAGGSTVTTTTTVDDWEMGEKQVEMYADILAAYPPKVTTDVCESCDGRGVIVCDNCQGTGLQPRFLERYSPDDFMD